MLSCFGCVVFIGSVWDVNYSLLVAYVDFNTIAMIACSVARHNLCRECCGSLSHDTHDKIFGGRRVYLVCLAIWMVSLAIILPDITGGSSPGQPLPMVVTQCALKVAVSMWDLSSVSLAMLSSWCSSILHFFISFYWLASYMVEVMQIAS